MTIRFSLREHRSTAGYAPDITFIKTSGSIMKMFSSMASRGSGYFFVTVNRANLNGKYLRFYVATEGVTNYCKIYDGAYDRSSMTDFPDNASMITKGNGLLQTVATLSSYPWGIKDVLVNVSGGNQTDCTIMFTFTDTLEDTGAAIYIDWFEINTSSGGGGNLYYEGFDDSVDMELGGTSNDYGYTSDDSVPVTTVVCSLREHKTYASYNPVITFSKSSATILKMDTTMASLGSGYFFIEVDRAWLNGKYIRFNWAGYKSGGVGTNFGVYIYDGSYNRSSSVDFPSGAGKLIKGAGLLQTLKTKPATFSAETVDTLINVSGGSQTKCTVFFEVNDGWNSQSLWLQIDWFEVNTAAGGSGNLFSEHFTDSVHMELTGTYGDYGYIGVFTPTVLTYDATSISSNQADLNGEITNCGGFDPTCDKRGFEYGTETGVYIYEWTESGSFPIGVFSHTLSDLILYQTYFFRAKAHSSYGWGYGLEFSFITSDNILSNDGGVLYLERILDWRETQECGVAIKDIPLKTTGQIIEENIYILHVRNITFKTRLTEEERDALEDIYNANDVGMLTVGHWLYNVWFRDKNVTYNYSASGGELRHWLATLTFVVKTFEYME